MHGLVTTTVRPGQQLRAGASRTSSLSLIGASARRLKPFGQR